jgi:DNA-binding winged helix-turn-helix (wHTH) protein
MALLNFGDFQLDVDARRIYSTDGELAAEPKVIEVLCYLIQHRDRLVPLTELHAEVWAGRIVTDTAVRRTISKLRALLGDTDPETPLYIKSQMKRGYQFIGQLVSHSELFHSTSSTSSDNNQGTATEKNATWPLGSAKVWYPILAILMFVVIALVSRQFFSTESKSDVLKFQSLVNIAGEKGLLSVSDNGRFQAFTGRLNKTEGWQSYVYDLQSGQLQKIHRPKHAAFPVVSIVNNDTVLLSTSGDNQVTLYLYSISNLNTPVKMIQLKDFYQIVQATSYQDQVVLINGQKIGEKNVLYYLLNLEEETLEQVTFSSSQNSVDLSATYSPDKKHYALIRADTGVHVQVYRTDNRELLRQESFERGQLSFDEMHLLWLNNGQLLFNYGDKLEELNVVSGIKSTIPVSERFSGFGRDVAGNLFGLLKRPQKKSFYQVQFSDLNAIQQYFSFPGQAVSLDYSQTSEKLWLIEQDQTGFQLHHYHPVSGDKKRYFEASERFSLAAEGHDGSYLLLFHKKQLKLLDKNTGELSVISDVNQRVRFPAPAADDKIIFFAELIGEDWQINAFNRETKSQSLVVKGYRVLLPWQKQFIAADAKGAFYLLDSQYQLVRQLPLEIDLTARHQINLRGNKLIVAYTNINHASNWSLAELDLVTDHLQLHPIENLPVKTVFSIDKDGSGIIISVGNDHESQLVKFGYNSGYN